MSVPIPTLIVNLDSDGDGVTDDADECSKTPLHTVVDIKGCEIIIEGGEALEMELQIFFAPLSSQLINSADKEFAKIEEKLNEHLNAKVFIFGHISSNELELFKDKGNLSRRRALTIKNRLVTEHHIESNRITTYDCSNKSLDIDSEAIHRNFNALNVKNIKSKQSRVTLMASSTVNDLMNLKYDYYMERYGEYAKNCYQFN